MRLGRLPLALAAFVPLACSSSYKATGTGGADAGDAGFDASIESGTPEASAYDGPSFGDDGSGPPPGDTLTSITIAPIAPTLVTLNGMPGTQQFTATGNLATADGGDAGSETLAVSWSSDQPSIGSIDDSGNFTALGSLGGVVHVTASYGMLSATTTLTVKLHYVQNPGLVPTATQMALQGATTPDATVKWAYPYDQTVFPRGINESTLMWLGGANGDYYYVHVIAATFELESYATAPQQRWDFTTTIWNQFLDSTSGPTELIVTRWDGTQATQIVDEHWTIANGSMAGTIYYAAYQVEQGAEIGKVLRIKPGAVIYDDFLQAGSTCTSCHTVSADGTTLVYGGGNMPPQTSYTYDLTTGTPVFSGFTSTDGGPSQWAVPGLSADGTTLVENFAPLYGIIGAQTGAFDPATGSQLTATGLEGEQLWMPTFSPDNQLIAYVNGTTHDLHAVQWDPTLKQASNDQIIVASSANPAAPQIQYPTVSPDHQWIVYQRGTALGSLGIPGDLYLASVTNPGTEIALGTLDGLTYPFAAGGRDQHLNYEPMFAPVAAGGYFWLIFHSRRTYGNELVQPAYSEPGVGLKQLWVAAFDQAPTAGVDPSHSPFYLGGQSPVALNTRGFWSLSPCLADGQSCQMGTDCCGGYCNGAPDGGATDAGLVCGQPMPGCSQDGNKCMQTADCCNAATGTTCINQVCSVPPPKPDGGVQ
jgi:hypothetical protein